MAYNLHLSDREKHDLLFSDISDDPAPRRSRPRHGGSYYEEQDQGAQAEARIDELLDENQASLGRSVQMARESRQIASDTNQKLAEQTEQMGRIDKDLNDVNRSLTFAERSMRGMASIGGSIANMFSKARPEERRFQDEGPSKQDREIERELERGRQEDARRARERNAQDAERERRRAQRLENRRRREGELERDAQNPQLRRQMVQERIDEAREAEDEQLDDLSDLLSGLKQDALVMNRQLGHQQKVLGHLDGEMSHTNDRMRRDNDRLGRLR